MKTNVSKPTQNRCIDIDGNVYKTIRIGNQVWMAENLKVTHYRNGDPISHLTDDDDWNNVSLGGGAYCVYDNNPSNAKIYGNLYNWFAVVDKRGLAPKGWHIPTDEEIKELEMALGMRKLALDQIKGRGTNEGSKLAGGYDLWLDGVLRNDPEFGTSGFSFLPGGYRDDSNVQFNGMVYLGYLWSSTENSSYNAWYRALYFLSTTVSRNFNSKRNGYSVRCVRD